MMKIITLQSAIDGFFPCCHAGFFGKRKENSDHASYSIVDGLDQAR